MPLKANEALRNSMAVSVKHHRLTALKLRPLTRREIDRLVAAYLENGG